MRRRGSGQTRRGLFKRGKGTKEFRTYDSESDVGNREEIPSEPMNVENR